MSDMNASERNATRRSFLKAAGATMMGVAATAGCLGLSSCSSPTTPSGQKMAGGIGKVDVDVYTDVFPVKTRNIPVIDVETDMRRRGTVAFENREIAESEIARTEECDVLVIGCGITGSCAALAASDDPNTKVICIEKMDVGRGIFEGMGVIGGKVMTEAGNFVDPAEMADITYFAANYRLPIDPVQVWVNRSGEAADWLQERFDEGDAQIKTYYKKTKDSAHGFYAPQTDLAFKSETFSEQTTSNAGGTGIFIVADLANTLSKRANADLRYNTPAVQLEREEGGRVTGAIARDADGYFRINAKNGVILATGGYDANPDMLKAWCRAEDVTNCSSWAPTLGTTGDGHLMGLKVGGKMDPIPHSVMNFCWGSPDAYYSTCFGIRDVMSGGAMINEAGRRFCSESLPYQAKANAIAAQKGYGESCWSVFGANSLGKDPETTRENLQRFIDKGWCFEADTLEGLAEAMGVPAETFVAEIERFNGFVANGKDEDFNRPMDATTQGVTSAPYYALMHQQSILATCSGLEVNADCNVIDYDNQVIEGLYAAGNASGGMFSGSYPRHIFGPSVGRCITFGYVAGKNASKGA